MNNKKITTEPSCGIDIKRVETSILILGIALIDLKGLSTRRTLNDFKLGIFGTNSVRETNTTIKSKIFHPSRI